MNHVICRETQSCSSWNQLFILIYSFVSFILRILRLTSDNIVPMTFAFSFLSWAGPSSHGRGLVTQPRRDQPLRCESSRIPLLLAPHLVAVTPCSTRGLLPLISPVKHGAPDDPARGPLRLCRLSAVCRRGGSAERTEGH